MVSKNFKLNILLRLLLISIAIGGFLYFVLITGQYLRSVYIFIFIVLAILEFLRYVDKTNRDFSSFLLAILQEDFSTTFSEKGKGKSFNKLYTVLNQITEKFKKISSEKELQHLYLETLVEHIKVGILSYDSEENIYLMNNTIKELLNRPHLTKLSSLENIGPELLKTIREIKPTENKLIKVNIDNHLLQLSIHASEFKLQKKYFKLISLQNIKTELEANELEAWQKLIRVLTHEIMNSVTPITSLTATLQEILKKEQSNLNNTDEKVLENLSQGLDAIKNRSKGLQTFTQAYKNLTKLPMPDFDKVKLLDIFDNVYTLLKKELSERNINYVVNIPDKNMKIIADRNLLEQVIINLIRNAIEALENVKNPRISVFANTQSDQKIHISISDNGEGIPEEELDKIFIPFFTTKKKGSGIGLAVSRQILQMHNGTISVQSRQGEGTKFTIKL